MNTTNDAIYEVAIYSRVLTAKEAKEVIEHLQRKDEPKADVGYLWGILFIIVVAYYVILRYAQSEKH